MSKIETLLDDVMHILDCQTKFNRTISNHLVVTLMFCVFISVVLFATNNFLLKQKLAAQDQRIRELERCSDQDSANIFDLQTWQMESITKG